MEMKTNNKERIISFKFVAFLLPQCPICRFNVTAIKINCSNNFIYYNLVRDEGVDCTRNCQGTSLCTCLNVHMQSFFTLLHLFTRIILFFIYFNDWIVINVFFLILKFFFYSDD